MRDWNLNLFKYLKQKNELYHKLDLYHQQILSEIEVTAYSCESYRLESKVNLSKEKQKISAEF